MLLSSFANTVFFFYLLFAEPELTFCWVADLKAEKKMSPTFYRMLFYFCKLFKKGIRDEMLKRAIEKIKAQQKTMVSSLYIYMWFGCLSQKIQALLFLRIRWKEYWKSAIPYCRSSFSTYLFIFLSSFHVSMCRTHAKCLSTNHEVIENEVIKCWNSFAIENILRFVARTHTHTQSTRISRFNHIQFVWNV